MVAARSAALRVVVVFVVYLIPTAIREGALADLPIFLSFCLLVAVVIALLVRRQSQSSGSVVDFPLKVPWVF
jgi:hypothetical protein